MLSVFQSATKVVKSLVTMPEQQQCWCKTNACNGKWIHRSTIRRHYVEDSLDEEFVDGQVEDYDDNDDDANDSTNNDNDGNHNVDDDDDNDEDTDEQEEESEEEVNDNPASSLLSVYPSVHCFLSSFNFAFVVFFIFRLLFPFVVLSYLSSFYLTFHRFT